MNRLPSWVIVADRRRGAARALVRARRHGVRRQGVRRADSVGGAGAAGSDGWSFYQPLIAATLGEALRGYLIGNGLALACAALVLLVPWLERLVVQLAVASYCLPLVAIGPILSLLLTGDAPMITHRGAVRVLHHAGRRAARAALRRPGHARRRPRLRRRPVGRAGQGPADRRAARHARRAEDLRARRAARRDHRRVPRAHRHRPRGRDDGQRGGGRSAADLGHRAGLRPGRGDRLRADRAHRPRARCPGRGAPRCPGATCDQNPRVAFRRAAAQRARHACGDHRPVVGVRGRRSTWTR